MKEKDESLSVELLEMKNKLSNNKARILNKAKKIAIVLSEKEQSVFLNNSKNSSK